MKNNIIDDFIRREYIPAFLINLRNRIIASGHNPDNITLEQRDSILQRIIKVGNRLINYTKEN